MPSSSETQIRVFSLFMFVLFIYFLNNDNTILNDQNSWRTGTDLTWPEGVVVFAQ